MIAFQAPKRPPSPGARKLPPPPNHMSFNYFSPDAFAVNTVYPTDSIIKGNDEDAGYRGQVTSLRTVGSFATRPVPPPVVNNNDDTRARFKKEKKKRRTRRRVPVVESDIYAMSSDED